MPADARKKRDRKDSQLIIRIKGSERDAFLALCDQLDTSAAREIRRFIREFILSHQDVAEGSGASRETNAREADEWQRNRKSKNSRKK